MCKFSRASNFLPTPSFSLPLLFERVAAANRYLNVSFSLVMSPTPQKSTDAERAYLRRDYICIKCHSVPPSLTSAHCKDNVFPRPPRTYKTYNAEDNRFVGFFSGGRNERRQSVFAADESERKRVQGSNLRLIRLNGRLCWFSERNVKRLSERSLIGSPTIKKAC